MRKITSPKVAVALAALLLLGGALASAPEARAGSNLNGVALNGEGTQGANLNGREINGEMMQGRRPHGVQTQGRPTGGAAAETASVGALQVRSVRLPDGRTLLAGQR